MEWEIEYSDDGPQGPFAPLARVSADSWWDAELALFETTDGVLGFGHYRFRIAGGAAPRTYTWTGEGRLQLVGEEAGVSELDPPASGIADQASPG